MKQKDIFSIGSTRKIRPLLKSMAIKKIFLVTGGTSYQTSGAKKALDQELNGYSTTVFSDFEINPKLKDIKKGISLFKKAKPDVVIAVGGGSVIDVAKSINILAANEDDPSEYITGKEKIKRPGKTLIAVPTTSGSGSEATHFAVVYIGKTKYSLAHQFILPSISLIDPQLTKSLPAYITACSGIDALAQAIEAYWSVNSTPVSKKYSTEAIKLVLANLPAAVNQPTLRSRIAMSQAAHLAGKAINIAKTTACHSIAYPITSFFGVPHGHAVGLTLSSLLKFNSENSPEDTLDRRGSSYVKKTINRLAKLISGASDPQKAAIQLDELLAKAGLERRLSKLNIKTSRDIGVILKNGFNPDRVKNNPRLLTKKSLKKILLNLL